MKFAHLSIPDMISKLGYKWVFCFWCVYWNVHSQKGANPSLVEVKLKT